MAVDLVVPAALRTAFEFVQPDRCKGKTLHELQGLDYFVPLQRYEDEGPQSLVVDVARHIDGPCRSCRYMAIGVEHAGKSSISMTVHCDLKRPNSFGVVCPAEQLVAAPQREKGLADVPMLANELDPILGAW